MICVGLFVQVKLTVGLIENCQHIFLALTQFCCWFWIAFMLVCCKVVLFGWVKVFSSSFVVS